MSGRETENGKSKPIKTLSSYEEKYKKLKASGKPRKKSKKTWWEKSGKKLIGAAVIVLALGGIITGIVLGTKDSNNNSVSEDKPTLMEIGSEGCQPCQLLKPHINKIKQNYGSKINVTVYDAWYTTSGAKKAEEYGVSVVPTLIFLNKDGKEIARLQGYQSYEALKNKLEKLGWV